MDLAHFAFSLVILVIGFVVAVLVETVLAEPKPPAPPERK